MDECEHEWTEQLPSGIACTKCGRIKLTPTDERGWTPLSLAQHFHNIYERCAPKFGYETRTETRQFNPESSNGKLMIAVCSEILRDFNAALDAEREKRVTAHCPYCNGTFVVEACHVYEIQQLREQLAAAQELNLHIDKTERPAVESLERKLAAAQATIKEHDDDCSDVHCGPIGTDTAALDAAIAAAQRPLVDALEKIREDYAVTHGPQRITKTIDDALAKVKEGK